MTVIPSFTIRIKKDDIIFLFLLLPYFVPGIVSTNIYAIMSFLDIASNIHRMVAALIIAWIYFFHSDLPCFKFIIMVTIYSSIMIISSVLKDGEIITSCIVMGTRVSLCMLIALMIERRRLHILSWYLEILIFINFFGFNSTIFIFFKIW